LKEEIEWRGGGLFRRVALVWWQMGLEFEEFFSVLLKFSQSQAKFLLSFSVNV